MVKRRIGSQRFAWILPCVLICSAAAMAQAPADTDRDGIPDAQEQALLEKFRPTFMISASDCAIRPARFEPDQITPQPAAADGSVYGQVFPVHDSQNVEIHYYTLWDRDCGRIQHSLDVEHVAVLVRNDEAHGPEALYWYAGAHENTACEISSGARAAAIDAEHRGAKVWSSSGKHAMYLRKAMCNHGCGADSCEDAQELAPSSPVINVGEPGAPANGALWTASPQWGLAGKMDSDFPPDIISRLEATSGESVITLRGRSSVRGTIRESDTVLAAGSTGAQHTGAALDTANGHTSRSLGKATRATGRSLKRAWNAVFGKSSPQNK